MLESLTERFSSSRAIVFGCELQSVEMSDEKTESFTPVACCKHMKKDMTVKVEQETASGYSFERVIGAFHEDASEKRVDTYRSMDALRASLKCGIDYEVSVVDRNSDITIVSPHGGFIEPGSSELAAAIAGEDYNLFDFRGLDANFPHKAHVTSARFRDPRLSSLLETSTVCVSVHGMRGVNKEIFIGGRNSELKALVAKNLRKAGFSVNDDPPFFRGVSKRNFVNMPERQGVQLELSWGIRKEIMGSQSTGVAGGTRKRFESFTASVREAIIEYRKGINQPDG